MLVMSFNGSFGTLIYNVLVLRFYSWSLMYNFGFWGYAMLSVEGVPKFEQTIWLPWIIKHLASTSFFPPNRLLNFLHD
jgi:hypothetical protein